MKIGIVTETCLTFPGGVQHYSRGLYDFFEKKGHHVEILTCGKESEETRKRFVTRLGKVLEVPLPRYSASAPITFTRSKTIGKFLIKRDFDILHFNGPAGLLSRQLLIYSKAVNILTFHIYHKRIYPFVITPFLPVWRNLTDKFAVKIAVSDTAASYAQKFHPGKYVVIRGGVDLSKYSLVDQKIKEFADGKTNILFVGRLDKRKGIIYLLKAFKKLNNHSDVRLLIVGDGPDKTKAKRFVRKNGLNNVEFLGRVGNDLLPQYYRTADIFCSPATHGESFGFVLIEAMAAGLPIVAYANEGYREVLGKKPFKDFLVKSKDVEGLAANLLKLIHNKNLRKKFGKKSLEEVQQYCWENVGKQILTIYNEALV